MGAMSDKDLNPAHSIIKDFGGAEAVAAITGKSVSQVYRWTQPKAKGGTGGLIPSANAARLLAHAQKHKMKITADRFFPEKVA